VESGGIPEQNIALVVESRQGLMNNGGGWLLPAGACELELGSESDTRVAGALVAGCLANEEDRSGPTIDQIGREVGLAGGGSAGEISSGLGCRLVIEVEGSGGGGYGAESGEEGLNGGGEGIRWGGEVEAKRGGDHGGAGSTGLALVMPGGDGIGQVVDLSVNREGGVEDEGVGWGLADLFGQVEDSQRGARGGSRRSVGESGGGSGDGKIYRTGQVDVMGVGADAVGRGNEGFVGAGADELSVLENRGEVVQRIGLGGEQSTGR
jgi:hypothetical protein